MPVNIGGRGSSISFMDLQDFYGGSHPISISEYYRGGGEVPSTSLSGNNPYTGTTSFSGSGTGSGGTAGISVTVATTPGSTSTSVGSLTTSDFSGNGIVNISDLSYVYARSQGRGNHTIVQYPQANGGGHPTQIFSYSQDDNPGFNVVYRGPVYQSGDGSPTVRSTSSSVSGSGSLGWSGFSTPGEIGRRSVTTTTSPSTHDITFTNNTGQRISLASSSTGGARTMEPGASVQVQNDGSSAGWSFNYSYVDAGSGSGTGDRPSAASIAVDVTTTAGGPGALTVTTRSSGASAIGFRTVQADRTELGIIGITSSTSFARVQYVNGNPTTDAARGPAWVSGDSGLGLTAAQVEALPQRAAGENVVGSGMNGSSLSFSGTGRATRGASTPDTHDISFQNNTGI